MSHYTPLMTTIVAGLGLAFVLGAIANRLKISPLVGYLLAGVVVGPHTPGFTADLSLASQLAEIGVVLLMFGVGLNFSLNELLSVRFIAIPGALLQIVIGVGLGILLGVTMGWPVSAGLVFGLALSVASTVVAMRALQERHLIETERGRITVGWLIVEDLLMILALVLLPSVADFMRDGATPDANVLTQVAITLGKVVAFVAVMLVVGRRVIPWILHHIAHTGSRELFRLAVLSIALGVAYGAAEIFDVSFALGAFFAGMVMAESQLSQQAAAESLPLRDAFAVLFFVSVGMLFDPTVVLRSPVPLVATFLIIVAAALIAALIIMRLFKRPLINALTVAAALGQIGEFSFILAGLGIMFGILPPEARDLILAGALLSILLNPAGFYAIERWRHWLEAHGRQPAAPGAPEPVEPLLPTTLQGHAVIVGYGRVGQRVADALAQDGQPFLIIEARRELAEQARARRYEAYYGNATEPEMLQAANIAGATRLFIAIPDAFEAGTIIEQARRLNPTVKIIARAHSDAEVEHLTTFGPDEIIMGEDQIARAMIEYDLAIRRTTQPTTAEREEPRTTDSAAAAS
jgi:CPA2 family monovalent cation:H+ antiporter-2